RGLAARGDAPRSRRGGGRAPTRGLQQAGARERACDRREVPLRRLPCRKRRAPRRAAVRRAAERARACGQGPTPSRGRLAPPRRRSLHQPPRAPQALSVHPVGLGHFRALARRHGRRRERRALSSAGDAAEIPSSLHGPRPRHPCPRRKARGDAPHRERPGRRPPPQGARTHARPRRGRVDPRGGRRGRLDDGAARHAGALGPAHRGLRAARIVPGTGPSVTPPPPPTRSRKRNPELFLNRELSLLEFQGRVLEEAQDASNPLLERLKFATIVASNLDEFFMVRVARLQHRVPEEAPAPAGAGFPPAQHLAAIGERVLAMVDALYAPFLPQTSPALAERGLTMVLPESASADQSGEMSRLFTEQFLPALTPL